MHKRSVIFLFILFCFLRAIQAESSSSSSSLTPPLSPRLAPQTISEEFLIHSKNNIFSNSSSVDWLANDTIIYSSQGKIELLNLVNNTKTSLGQGYNPKISPDGNWIAFISKNENGNQIWLMKKDGSEKKRLNLNENLISSRNYHFGFSWSLDSKYLACYFNPPNPNPDLTSLRSDLPPSTIHVIDLHHDTVKKVIQSLH